MSMMENQIKPKTFWKKPEGKTGMIVAAAGLGGLAWVMFKYGAALVAAAANTINLVLMLVALAAIVYVILDPKFRNLAFYVYKSIMRFITGIFVQIDPIGILQSYVEDLKTNLKKMNKQIGLLRGQMRKLNDVIQNNKRQIASNIKLADKAKRSDKDAIMILKSRKAGRLKESNLRLEDLYKKMEVLYRVLVKMYENSEILLEDVADQVEVKKQERAAIRASHSAMKSAMNIISGKGDKREMFDQALEHIADDVSMKIGEMERFMDLSTNFMDSIDLQNGIFEEEGLAMLEKWEKEGVSLILGQDKDLLVMEGNADDKYVDLDAPLEQPKKDHDNQYSNLFDF
ncbi:MAG: hypothetical protein R2730_16305 [Chitinophagales bacterium]